MVKPTSEVYTAAYSGIQVFEMSVGDCTMMRRRSDSYLNATQILKLGGLDKGKRTKVLEREVIPKTHEKIQGGYGKYQGTWVPLDIGRELAERYEVLHLLLPLLDFDPSTWDELPEKEQMPTRTSRARINHGHPTQTQPSPSLSYASQQESLTSGATFKRKSTPFENDESDEPRLESSPSTLPIPLALPLTTNNTKKKPRVQAQPKQKLLANDTNYGNKDNDGIKSSISSNTLASPARSTIISKKEDGTDTDTKHNREIVLSIFSPDDEDTIPSYFYSAGATTGIDLDISIDEQGHTALHWSVSLGRMHTVEWLISKGAKVIMVNSAGETPLMRGVMATFIYDHDCFPQMLDILRDSLSLVDYVGRNVLHHIILLTLESKITAKLRRFEPSTPASSNDHAGALSSTPDDPPPALIPVSSPSTPSTPITTTASTQYEDRLTAAKSYMAQVIKVVGQHNEHTHILNQPDLVGETPYALARRLNCVDICYLLEQSGCCISSQDSGVSSFMVLPPPVPEKQTELSSKRPRKKTEKRDRRDPLMGNLENKGNTKGQQLVATVQRIVDSMDMEFSSKLQAKEADISRLQQEIWDLTQQLEEAHRQQQGSCKSDSGELEEANAKIKQLENRLGNAGVTDLDIGTTTDTTNSNEQQQISTVRDNAGTSEREKQLEQQIILLQSQLTDANSNTQDSRALAENHSQTLESLAACKRLIAVCCNLPLEKVDDFIGPLTTAIENDPPDLDFARVIGFMEKLREHQQ